MPKLPVITKRAAKYFAFLGPDVKVNDETYLLLALSPDAVGALGQKADK
jgi:hypothetical protein